MRVSRGRNRVTGGKVFPRKTVMRAGHQPHKGVVIAGLLTVLLIAGLMGAALMIAGSPSAVSAGGVYVLQDAPAVATSVSSPALWYAAPGAAIPPGQLQDPSASAVSCGAPGFCMAFGLATSSTAPNVEILQHGVWTVASTLPPNDVVTSLSCAAYNFCRALGADGTTYTATRLALTYNNGAWSSVPLTGAAAQMTLLSCPTVNNCGGIGISSLGHVIVGSLSAGVWTTADAGFMWTGPIASLSCPTATYCASVAGGMPGGGDGSDLLIQTVNGVTTENAAPPDLLHSISCPAVGTCFAAGENISTATPTMFAFANGSWQQMAQPAPDPGSNIEYLESVSCSSVDSCVAVGFAGVVSLVETLSNGTWVQNPSQNIGTQENDPTSVSCVASFCIAIGNYTPSDGRSYTLVMGEGVTDPTTHTTAYVLNPTVASGRYDDYYATVTSPGGIPTGTVTFTTGSTLLCTKALGNGSTGCDSTAAPVGTDIITAAYSGDTYFNPSATTMILIVTPGSPGSPPPAPVPHPTIGMASTPDGSGYWLANSAGAISAHGSAQIYGSAAGLVLNSPISHIVSTPDGRGYWLVANDGGIFSFGDAGFYGSMGAQHLNSPVVGIASTPSGKGYWLVASDGGIFAFGDAAFHGSMGSQHLNRPVVGMSADNQTGGYWEVATDGGIFAFGAPFFGSTGAIPLNSPVNGMTPTSNGRGYWFVASDGGVFAFGNAGFHGSMGGQRLSAPIVGMASDNSSGGYWLVGSDGGIFSCGAPFYGAG